MGIGLVSAQSVAEKRVYRKLSRRLSSNCLSFIRCLDPLLGLEHAAPLPSLICREIKRRQVCVCLLLRSQYLSHVGVFTVRKYTPLLLTVPVDFSFPGAIKVGVLWTIPPEYLSLVKVSLSQCFLSVFPSSS